MNTRNILIGVAALVILGVGAYFVMNGQGLGNFGNPTPGAMSMRDLLASNASQKCTFTTADSSGSIYVSNGKMRGDFTSQSDGGTVQTHMVISNGISYVWTDGTAQGFRVNFEDMTAQGSAQGSNQGVDADAEVATDCITWQGSESSFDLPTDVNFIDASAMTGAFIPPTGTGSDASVGAGADANASYSAQQCAACEMIPDAEGKEQCKASFDCR